jgi:PAS domain S-box-containing protein
VNLKTLALLPVVALVALIFLTLFLNLSEKIAFNPPYLLLSLNLIFWTTATLAIAFISAKSFLKEDSSVVLVNSCSIIVFGLPVIISGWVQTFSINESIALSNPCILVASILQVLSSILAFQGKQETKTSNRKRLLSITYVASVIFVLANTAVALLGYYPPFFAASGPTLLRQVVLGASVFFFGVAAIVFGIQYLRSKSPSLYWYTLAIGLFSVGLFSAFEQKAIGDVPTWLGRSALYVGTLYLTAAILASRQKTGTDLASKWAEAFRSNPKQIADFFSNMIEGFVYCRILTDASGKPIDYVYLDANDAAERFVGVKRENLLGKRATEVFPEVQKDPAKWIGVYGTVALTGEATTIERYSPDVNRWYHASIYSPQKSYFVVIFEDITERKKAEEALIASEQKANDLIKYAPSGIYELDYRIPPGYTREELFAMSPFALLDDESKTRFRERIMKMLAGEKVDETVEFKVIAKNGRNIDAVLNTTFTYKDGKPDGALVVALDVTERKKAERSLEERAKNLESLVEERTKALRNSERLAAIGATAGMVGHDIRNPLQAITGDVYLVKTDLAAMPDSEEKKNILESLQEIEKNVNYVNKIVADLQDFARPILPKLEEIDLEQIIHFVLARLDIPGNVTVKHLIRKDFPKVKADQAYMQRILTNLANNAIQAMPKGGKLTINAIAKNGKAIISVEDNGEGVPENVRSKLFTPLVTTKSKGQGFGLSVVKRFTEGMGGTVTFESEVGKGTKFIVELPL